MSIYKPYVIIIPGFTTSYSEGEKILGILSKADMNVLSSGYSIDDFGYIFIDITIKPTRKGLRIIKKLGKHLPMKIY